MELTSPLKTKQRPGLLPLGETAGLVLSRILWALGPIVGFLMVEYLNYNTWGSLTFVQAALNLGFYYLIAGLLHLMIGRRGLSCGAALTLFWAVGMANHYVLSFRGRTIFPGDLLGLQTAINVSGNYSYVPDAMQLATLGVLLFFLVILFLLPRQRERSKLRVRSALPAGLAGVAFVAIFFGTSFLSLVGIEPSMWTTIGNGFVLNFSVCLKYSQVDQPEGYSQETLASLEEDLTGGLATHGAQGVNVIAIMNESFSDLSVLGDLKTNQDALPFWHSLTENTVRGYAYSSVFGGTTANSEFEFLTGHSTAFTPAGTVPYQMYIREGAASLVSQMNDLGYTTIASHPYRSSGWNRPAVYADLGFSQTLFEPDFEDAERWRGYVTDQSNYEKLVQLYEEKTPGEKLFLFNVTMQNHSGYDVPWTTLPREVALTGSMAKRYPSVDQYLSLVYQSDRAFEYLINYFSQVEEPTVILMFGDHQPQVSASFYRQMLGTDPDLAEQQEKYKVPFLLWANYDIAEEQDVTTSLNYLSTLLMERANLPLTGYQQFLKALEKQLPAINANGFLDKSGQWHESADTLDAQAKSALNEYQMLQYNELFEDRKARMEDVFFLRTTSGAKGALSSTK